MIVATTILMEDRSRLLEAAAQRQSEPGGPTHDLELAEESGQKGMGEEQ